MDLKPDVFYRLIKFVFFFPPKLELITTQAMRAGFGGGMVVDYPNSSKAKKSVAMIKAGLSIMTCAAAAVCK